MTVALTAGTGDDTPLLPNDAADDQAVHRSAGKRRRGKSHHTEGRKRRRAAAFAATLPQSGGHGDGGDTADAPGA